MFGNFIVSYDRNHKDIYTDDASVNYWPGFVAYTKIILLTYCNDKSKNTTKNHYYIRTQVEILFANVLIFLFIRNMGSSGC